MPDSKCGKTEAIYQITDTAPIQDSATFDGAPSFTIRNRLFRLLWHVAWKLLASWTPAPLHRWRIWLINLFGGQVDWSCFVYGSARIWYPPHLRMHRASTLGPEVDCYTMAPVELHEYAVVSQRAFLCTGSHRIDHQNFQLHTKPIQIGRCAWIGAEAFVGPGVIIGEGAVLGARGVTFHDLDSWTVYLGNPATVIRARTQTEAQTIKPSA